jgi:hypothetical protein
MRIQWIIAFGLVLTLCGAAQSQDAMHVMANRASAIQAANQARTLVELPYQGGRAIVSAFEINGDGTNGPAGTIQPGIGVWDATTGKIISDVQINVPPNGHYAGATSNPGHDAPQISRTANGGMIVTYGAVTTYRRYHPDPTWACLNGTFCQPFKYALPRDANGTGVAQALARSTEYLLPSSGISEISSASIGDATIMAGQQQTPSNTSVSGNHSYVTFHATSDGGRFDTTQGPWNFMSSHLPPAWGVETITRIPNDDAYFDFAIISAQGAGTISLSIGSDNCTMSNFPANGNEADAAQAFVNYASKSCPAFKSKWGALVTKFEPFMRINGSIAPANTVVGIVANNVDTNRLPPAKTNVRLACSGGISCGGPYGPNTVIDERASGRHRHFLWGGEYRLGAYIYDITDVQQVTASYFGAGHNSLALAISCYRTSGPKGATWTWTDCGGRNPFNVAPGTQPQDRLGNGSPYLIRPPASGYPSNMTPYIYDWSMEAQPPAGSKTFPVLSAESATLLPNGDLLIAHGCQLRDTKYGICYVRFDTANDRTRNMGIVDAPSGGGSLASLAVRSSSNGASLAALAGLGARWGCGGSGPCALTYSFDANSNTWRRTSAQSYGGANDAGFPGVVNVSSAGFIFALKQRVNSTSARILTFERAVP